MKNTLYFYEIFSMKNKIEKQKLVNCQQHTSYFKQKEMKSNNENLHKEKHFRVSIKLMMHFYKVS